MNKKFSHFVLTMFMLITSVSIFAQSSISPRIEDLRPLKVGDVAPSFTVFREDGSPYLFDPKNLDTTTVIIFYRGGWCGACNAQLRDVATVMPDIMELGVDVIFPNGDRPEILYSSLRPETKKAIEGLDYQLFSDSGLYAAQAFRVTYVLDEETLMRYRSREEWDLNQSSIAKFDALPLPSIWIVDTNGKIAFQYHNLDPTIRLPSAELLEKIKEIKN